MMSNENNLMEKQYKLAIEARDKLNDNYHKWMTYYYVANGAVLIAITSLYNKGYTNKGILALSTIGVFVCILWNFSCKGYYYWSINWIYIIIALEKRLTNGEVNLGVYSVFSKKVAEGKKGVLKVNKGANISTPKLTLLLSFCSIICWAGFSIWQFYLQYKTSLPTCCLVLIPVFSLCIGVCIYYWALPKFAQSREDQTHVLI